MKSTSFVRAWTCLLVLILLSALSFAAEAQPGASSATQLSNLPPNAQATISAALGRDDARYLVQPAAAGFQAQNQRHGLAVTFTSNKVEVRRGAAHWRLAFAGYGYGDVLKTTGAATLTSSANRVEYRRGALTEWYVNGPLGLEQGFTIGAPPAQPRGGPLTVALNLSGNITAVVEPGGAALALTEGKSQATLRYAGLGAHDAGGTALRAWMELRGARLLLRVDDTGARYPVVVDPWVQQAKLTAYGGKDYDWFGWSVAISGDTVVVGAPNAPADFPPLGALTPGPGAVYVFTKPTGGWTTTSSYTAKLTASNGAVGDSFGQSVATSADGNTIVVGAPGAAPWGRVYVFVRPGPVWADMMETFESPCPSNGVIGGLGSSVAVSGDGRTLVAGDPDFEFYGADAPQQGRALIASQSDGWGTGTLSCQTLVLSNGAAYDLFGSSVAISGDGNTVVVGAPQAGTGPGVAYVFLKSANSWLQVTKLAASDAVNDDRFGSSVAISGDTVVVGAMWAHINDGTPGPGAAYVFLKPASGWPTDTTINDTAKLTAFGGANLDEFGGSVAVSGDTVVVGADYAKVASNMGQGAAYVFAKPANGWTATSSYTAKLTASDGTAGDYFGHSVAIGGDTAVAGAFLATHSTQFEAGPGAAYVFGVASAQNLELAVTATPAFTRTFNWSISKSVAEPKLVKQVGGSATFNYTVKLNETGFTDSGWAISGQITISNPNSSDASGVNLTAAVDNGGSCTITSGTGITVPASGSVPRNYTCTWISAPSPLTGTVTATATFNGGSASNTATFAFNSGTTGNPTNVNGAIGWTDTFDNGIPARIMGPPPTTSEPYTSAEWSPIPFTVPVPAFGCASHTNTAAIVQTGQSSTTPSVTVCGPVQTGATGSGSWQNKNGQSLIQNSGSTAGVCNLTAWLRQFAPFQDLSATASCGTVATYVSNVINGANASGPSMNAMLKRQMLGTALSVYFNSSIGGVPIDLKKVCTALTFVGGSGTCSAYANVSAAFGGATSLTISQMLAYAASQSNAGGSLWYGNVKSMQELAKDAFDAINNQAAFAP